MTRKIRYRPLRFHSRLWYAHASWKKLCILTFSECSVEHPCEGLDKHAHFRNFGMAFLTLFRVATGDNWNGIMKVTSERHDVYRCWYEPFLHLTNKQLVMWRFWNATFHHWVCFLAPGHTTSGLWSLGELRSQLLHQLLHCSCFLRCICSDGSICTRQRRRCSSHETSRGKNVPIFAVNKVYIMCIFTRKAPRIPMTFWFSLTDENLNIKSNHDLSEYMDWKRYALYIVSIYLYGNNLHLW